MDFHTLADDCSRLTSMDSEIWAEREVDRSFEWDGNVLKSTEVSQDQGMMLRVASEDKIGSAYANGDHLKPNQLVKNAETARNWVEAEPDRSLSETTEQSSKSNEWLDPCFEQSPSRRTKRVEEAIREHVDCEQLKTLQVTYGERSRETELYRKHQLRVSQGYTSFSFGVWAVCEEDGDVETGYERQSARLYQNLEPIRVIKTALRRARRQLGAEPASRHRGPMVLSTSASSQLLRLVRQMIDGESMIHGRSAWTKNELGESVAGKDLTVVDDPVQKGGAACREFDDEGMPMEAVNVIEDGILRHFLTNQYVACHAGISDTHRARRTYRNRPSVGHTNLVLKTKRSKKDPVEELGNGPVITDLQTGSGLDPVAGRFSVGAKGYHVVDGEFSGSFQEGTLSGSIEEFLDHILVAGESYPTGYQIASPALLVEGLTLGGA